MQKNKGLILLFYCLAVFSPALAIAQEIPSRDEFISGVLDALTIDPTLAKTVHDSATISGSMRASFGINSDGDMLFRRSNQELNERNWRVLNGGGLNNYQNTYDPSIYSRLKVVLDAKIQESVSMHMNVTVDPWSFTGKSQEQTVVGSNGDIVKIRYLSTGATGVTVDRRFITTQKGNGVNIPEQKMDGNMVPAVTATSASWEADTFNIAASKMEYAFNPLREMWFDIKPGDKGTIRIFPIAYQDQALTSDDPLHLSNNMIYWEPSPWINSWRQGNYNPVPNDFTKGQWDNSLAYSTRDGDGLRLTALRGMSIDLKPNEGGSLKATVASPKTIWDDYSVVTAVPGSLRYKQFLSEGLFLGTTENMHLGFADNKLDATNLVRSVDTGFLVSPAFKVNAQLSSSSSVYNQTMSAYETHRRGNAYYLSVEGNTSPDELLNKDYFGAQAPKGEKTYAKTRMFFGEMDKDFESSLSNYHATRNDSYWSRHLTFYPSLYSNLPGADPVNSESDLEPFAVGNGLDYGRKVVGWRGDIVLLEGFVKGMGDVRYVTNTNNEHVETVSRTQWEYKATDQLTTKALLVDSQLPKTKQGKDPFITDGQTGAAFDNTAVKGGEDPSVRTGAFGARYQVNDQVAVNGVWEHTNDKAQAADNEPQRAFDELRNYSPFVEDGMSFRQDAPLLYAQDSFDQAPYKYFDIYKTGLELKPVDKWTVYLDYTRNGNKFASNVDDNMNHYGIETSYVPTDKWGFYSRYTFVKMNDLAQLVNNGQINYQGHGNAFVEARYSRTKDTKLSMQYGVGPAYSTSVSTTNPSLAYYNAPVLDTQHIIRMTYEKKF
ncbi:MAG: hypothetical protein HQL22_07960 [Candidatus Omnitrophica bacterium]|nr:hypothetical protein [Candidatus Omnitrophota bacterium]